MKTCLLTLSLATLVLLQVGCGPTPVATDDATATPAAPAKLVLVEGAANTVSFNVPGMTCEHCAGVVEETLAGASGVEACTVNLDQKVAIVKINPDKYNADAVLKALVDAGYKDSTLKN